MCHLWPIASAPSSSWGSQGSGNGQLNAPVGVGTDASGANVYVADYTNDRIQKFDYMGSFLTEWGSGGPMGVATDASGNVYVVDAGSTFGGGAIQKFDSSGNLLTQWGGSGSGDGQFSWPTGVATDTSGDVYVADSGNNRIQMFSSSGAFIIGFGTAEHLSDPESVAADPYGYVYVADTGNNRIQKYSVTTSTPTAVVSPKDGATGVPRTTKVEATFSEPMDKSTITSSTFTLTKYRSSDAVAATVTVSSDGKTATLAPLTKLAKQRYYVASLSVKDPAGNTLNKTWTFKTGRK